MTPQAAAIRVITIFPDFRIDVVGLLAGPLVITLGIEFEVDRVVVHCLGGAQALVFCQVLGDTLAVCHGCDGHVAGGYGGRHVVGLYVTRPGGHIGPDVACRPIKCTTAYPGFVLMTTVGGPVLAGTLVGEDLGIRGSARGTVLLTTTHDKFGIGVDLVIGGQGGTVALNVGVTGRHVGADVTGCILEGAINLALVLGS
ncbi:hypothetical protein D3C79_595330 [compost metagenome]